MNVKALQERLRELVCPVGQRCNHDCVCHRQLDAADLLGEMLEESARLRELLLIARKHVPGWEELPDVPTSVLARINAALEPRK
jgi:hypothetical protein